jgi:hypothetical protein
MQLVMPDYEPTACVFRILESSPDDRAKPMDSESAHLNAQRLLHPL